MMTVTLIGYPFAGQGWHYAGHANELQHTGTGTGTLARFGAEVFTPSPLRLSGLGWQCSRLSTAAPRRTDWGLLPAGLGDIATRQGGDITGAKGSKAKRARAQGTGDDLDYARARARDKWLAGGALSELLDTMGGDDATARAERAAVEGELATLRAERARILASIEADSQEGLRVMLLAGGAAFAHGQRISLNGGGMAPRAARYLNGKRGHTPSDTSLQEACAAAAAVMWFEWCCYSALVGNVWNDLTVRHLASYGWRAAFASLTGDDAQGRTGDRAGRDLAHGGESVSLDAAQLQIERKSLEHWARDRQGRIFDNGGNDAQLARARRAVLQWVASVLDVKARGHTGAAERARFSVIARLVHGRDIATAAHGAGFASGRAALESFRSGKVWARLRARVAQHTGARERSLLAARLRAVRAAMLAIDAQHKASAGAAAIEILPPMQAVATLTSGACKVTHFRRTGSSVSRLVKVTRPAARRTVKTGGIAGQSKAHAQAHAYAAALDARAAAVTQARAARAMLLAARQERVAQFDKATTGLRAGWLR